MTLQASKKQLLAMSFFYQGIKEAAHFLGENVLQAYKISCHEQTVERRYLAIALPMAAAELKLSKNWTYRQLYVSMLEAAAKQFKVKKYKVYTIEELLKAIIIKADRVQDLSCFPVCIKLIIGRN